MAGPPSTRTRLPGESGSCPRMVSTSSSSGRNAGRSSARLSASRHTRPAASTTSSIVAGGTDTVTGAKTRARNASTSTAALVPNTRQNSGSEFSRVRTAQASHARRGCPDRAGLQSRPHGCRTRARPGCMSWTIPASGSRTTRSRCSRRPSVSSRAPAIERAPRSCRPPWTASSRHYTPSVVAAMPARTPSSRPATPTRASRGDTRALRPVGPDLALAQDRHTSGRPSCWPRSTTLPQRCEPRPHAARGRASSWPRRWKRPQASPSWTSKA